MKLCFEQILLAQLCTTVFAPSKLDSRSEAHAGESADKGVSGMGWSQKNRKTLRYVSVGAHVRNITTWNAKDSPYRAPPTFTRQRDVKQPRNAIERNAKRWGYSSSGCDNHARRPRTSHIRNVPPTSSILLKNKSHTMWSLWCYVLINAALRYLHARTEEAIPCLHRRSNPTFGLSLKIMHTSDHDLDDLDPFLSL